MPVYQLYYYVGFSGRALPIELLLTDGGVTYEKVAPQYGAERVFTNNPG